MLSKPNWRLWNANERCPPKETREKWLSWRVSQNASRRSKYTVGTKLYRRRFRRCRNLWQIRRNCFRRLKDSLGEDSAALTTGAPTEATPAPYEASRGDAGRGLVPPACRVEWPYTFSHAPTAMTTLAALHDCGPCGATFSRPPPPPLTPIWGLHEQFVFPVRKFPARKLRERLVFLYIFFFFHFVGETPYGRRLLSLGPPRTFLFLARKLGG